MIERAGTGVAVGNATPYVRGAADLVVAACPDDGVAEAISAVLWDRR
jgi:hydroxymethylpyrimidine pyrophosphatase-like HAD family hydrolase